MATDFAATPPAQFSTGRALKDTLRVLKLNFGRFAAIAIAFELLSMIADAFDDSAGASAGGFSWWSFAVEFLADVSVSGLTDAALTFGALQALAGHRVSFGDLVRGLTFALPIIAVNTIIYLPFAGSSLYEATVPGEFDGVSLVIGVAGMILTVIWFTAAPSIVAEGIGVLAALRRSALLTKGKRWEVFGLILLAVLVFVALDVVVAKIGGAAGASSATITLLTFWTTEYITSALLSAFMAVLAAVSYLTLRSAKEGAGTQEIARVFE